MKAWLAIFMIIFIWSAPISARVNDPVNYCAQTTHLESPGAIICHREGLSDVEITNAFAIIRKAIRLYPQFANAQSLNPGVVRAPIVIVILDKWEMNNPELFSGYDINGSLASARFLPNEKIICLIKESLSLTDPNLPHELAHLLNSESGIKNKARDETLAYSFEHFYFSR